MSFPRYPKYKPSGVAWLSEVPAHWISRKIGSISSLKGRLGWQGLKAEEYRVQGPYVVSSAHFEDRKIQWDECPRVSLERYETDSNIQLAANDVLLMKDGAAMGKLAFVDRLPGPACLNSHLLLFRPVKVDGADAYSPRFMFYFMQTGYFQEHIKVHGTGATFLGVSQEAIGRYQIVLPTLSEQTSIAEFLNRETAKIDGLVAEQRRLMELLKEKRQAVISHTVTRGLNPKVLLKPSGIEWLGDVPAHWTVASVRRVVRRIEQGWSPDCFGRSAESNEWGVVKSGCVNRGVFVEDENKALPETLDPIPEYEIRAGDVLMSRASGSPELVGSTAYITATRSKLMLSDKIFRVHPEPIIDREFFVAVFNSRVMRSQIERAISGADGLANNLPQSALKGFFCVVPPLQEQTAIVEYLRSETAKFDTLTAEAQRAIDLLQERRTALISAAVTGQIDVRHAGEYEEPLRAVAEPPAPYGS